MARVRIGELLMRQGRIDGMQLESALAHQRHWGGRLGRAVIHLGFIDEASLLEALGEQLATPFMTIGDRFVEPAVLKLVPEKLIRGHKVLPISRAGAGRRGPLVVALSDPGNLGVIEDVEFATGMDVRPVLATEYDVDQAIQRLLGPAPATVYRTIELPEDTNPLTVGRRPPSGVMN
jgi:type IV pilus assembly protein PilB